MQKNESTKRKENIMSDNLLNSNKDENTSKNTAEEIKTPLNDDIGSNVPEMADN